MKRARLADAHEAFARGLKLDPSNESLTGLDAFCLAATGQPSQALALVDHNLKVHPNASALTRSILLVDKGFAYAKLGQRGPALDALHEANRIYPQDEKQKAFIAKLESALNAAGN